MELQENNVKEYILWYIENNTSIQSITQKHYKKYKLIHNLLEQYKGDKYTEKLYNYIHNTSNKCKTCDKETNFVSFNDGYRDFCSSSCSMKNAVTKEKRKNTIKEKYGEDVENIFQVKSVVKHIQTERNKNKQEINDKIKLGHAKRTEEDKEKTLILKKNTCIEKYGVDNPMKNEKVKEKTRNTCMEKYGVNSVLEIEENRKRGHANCGTKEALKNKKNTNIRKFGTEWYSKTEEYRESVKKTCMEKYGVEHYTKTEECKEKTKKTNMEKYGVEHYAQTGLTKNGYKYKDYILPSGKTIKLQGYENYLLDELLIDYKENDILTDKTDMPKFWYIGEDNKKHRYFPDVYIPATNTIYEVKSEYTMISNFYTNLLKMKSVEDEGFSMILRVYDRNGYKYP